MNLSYWEYQSWLTNIDYTIVGSGIVGLNAALHLKKRFPKARVLILERGFLPNGASTKNAGFACFGSLSEILDDLDSQPQETVVKLVKKRLDGLALLRNTLGDRKIEFRQWGGYEFFLKGDVATRETCFSRIEEVNEVLQPLFNEKVFKSIANKFKFEHIEGPLLYNKFEGQIHTGKMMEALLHKVQVAGVKILNNITVETFSESGSMVAVKTSKFEFKTAKLLIANNGFAREFGISETQPARAQVLITKPIKNLKIKGTFHIDKGYYYFRNIDNRILFGGGRNLDFKAEKTTVMGQTKLVQEKLEELLKSTILPHTTFEIENRWSGIMGVGNTKDPIVKHMSQNVVCGVRLGGMGVAIGSLTGRELAELI